MNGGGQVGVYANEIKMMTRFIGKMKRIVKLAFVTGFPGHILVGLQKLLDIQTISIEDFIARVVLKLL